MQVVIKLKIVDLDDAIAVLDRVRGVILEKGDRAIIANGGLEITSPDPLRVMQDLKDDGFLD